MADGIKTVDVTLVSALDDVLGNQTIDGVKRTRRAAIEPFAEQLAGTVAFLGAIGSAAAGDVVRKTWTGSNGLNAVVGTRAGQPARVTGPDAGTHTDPVVGGVVSNVGEFAWSVAAPGWERVGDLVDAAAIRAEVLAGRGAFASLLLHFASKANAANSALTGTPTAPTATLGTNTTQLATTAFVKAALDALLAGAPGALDTLLELANALGNDPNFAATIAATIATKLTNKGALDAAGQPLYPTAVRGDHYFVSVAGRVGGPTGINVDVGDVLIANTDVAGGDQATRGASWTLWPKAVSLLRPDIDCSGNPNYPATNKGWMLRVSVAGRIGGGAGPTVEVGDLLLARGDNNSGGTHAVAGGNWMILPGTASLALKAPLASPALTGVPTAPTATLGTNTTQLATTAFVKAALDALLAGAPGALDTLLELANALGNDPNFATTVLNQLSTLGTELTNARGPEASVVARLDRRDRDIALIDRRNATILDRSWKSPIFFDDGSLAFGADGDTGEIFMASRKLPTVTAYIQAGDAYVVKHSEPRGLFKKTLRLTYDGKAIAVRAHDGNVHIDFSDGTEFWSEAEALWGIDGDRTAFSTLGAYVTELRVVPGSGQSNSAGGGQTATAVIVTSTSYNSERLVKFNGGVRPLDAALPDDASQDYNPTAGYNELLMHMPWSCTARLVPLTETITAIGAVNGETPMGGVGKQMVDRLASTIAVLPFISAVGGADYNPGLKKGSPVYKNAMNCVRRAKVMADMIGIVCKVREWMWTHGEQYIPTNPAASVVTADLVEYQNDIDTDVKAITGQAETVRLIVTQVSSWTAPVFSRPTSNVPQGMLDAMIANPTKITVCAARHHLTTGPDGIHHPATVTKQMGEEQGRCAVDGRKGIYVLSATATGTQLDIATNAVNPLSLTSTIVSDPGQLGVRITVSSGSVPTLSSPVVVGGSTVRFTMSFALTAGQSPKLGIADLGVAGTVPGPTTTGSPRTPIHEPSTDLAHDGVTLMHRFMLHISNLAITVI